MRTAMKIFPGLNRGFKSLIPDVYAAWILFFLAAGAIARLAFQAGRPFYGDEIGTLLFIRESYQFIFTHFEGWLTMNYFIALEKLLYNLFSESSMALLAVPFLAGLAAIPLTADIARELAGKRVALLAGFLATTNHYFIYYSVVIRSYSLLLSFSLGAMLAFLKWRNGQRLFPGICCALCCLGAMLFHPNGIYATGVVCVLCAFLCVVRGRTFLLRSATSFGLPLALALALTFLAYLPLQAPMRTFKALWSAPPPTQIDYLPALFTFFFGAWYGILATSIFIGVGLWVAVRHNLHLLYLAAGIVLPMLFAAFLGVSHYPWAYARLLIVVLPLMLVLVAVGIDKIAGLLPRHADLALSLMVVLLALSWLPGLDFYLECHRRLRTAELASNVLQEQGPEDVILHFNNTVEQLLPYLPRIRSFSEYVKYGAHESPHKLFFVYSDWLSEARTTQWQLRTPNATRLFGGIQLVVYDGANKREIAVALYRDLKDTVGDRIDPVFSRYYRLILDLQEYLGIHENRDAYVRLYYECYMRTKRVRSMPEQLLYH